MHHDDREDDAPKEKPSKNPFTGFFNYRSEKTDSYGDPKLRYGKMAAHSLGAMVAATALATSLYINESTEKSLEITFGKVTKQVDTPGIKAMWPFGIDKRFAISTAKQNVELSFDKLRTGDDIKMRSDFDIEFQVREKGDIRNYYNDLKGRDGDVKSIVEARGNKAAIEAVEKMSITDLIPPLDKDGKPEKSDGFSKKMTENIKTRLQELLDGKDGGANWEIEILGVYPKGFAFEPESEAKLAEIVGIRQEAVKLVLREKNAIKAKEVYGQEAAADAAYLKPFQDAGITDSSALAQIFCLKTARDAANVNAPLTPGCMGSDSGVAVAVDPKKTSAPAP